MVKCAVVVETVVEGVDEFDRLAELTDEMQLKQENQDCVHASNELQFCRDSIGGLLSPPERSDLSARDVIVISKDYNLIDETVIKEWEEIMERAVTTASSLEAENDSDSGLRCQDTILGGAEAQIRFEAASKQSNDQPLSRVNTLRSGEDNIKLKEMIELCTKMLERALDLA
ncbi:hypothetical protein Tco_0235868 [Tanacetum coccineum]